MSLDPVDVAVAEVRDTLVGLAEDFGGLVGGVGRLGLTTMHLSGELLLQAGVRGRLVRLLVGQPRRETCRLGWGGRVFDRMEACR